MDELLIFVFGFFVLIVGLIWAALHFGGSWFRKRQSKEASAASQALEGMFIFAGAMFMIRETWMATGEPTGTRPCTPGRCRETTTSTRLVPCSRRRGT